jgi:hypothetical protein
VVGCADPSPDVGSATATFADCLERNGIEVQDLELTLNDDTSVGGISATILGEADVPSRPLGLPAPRRSSSTSNRKCAWLRYVLPDAGLIMSGEGLS